MAHEIHDENGHLSLGPTINGRRQLQKFLSAQTNNYPALNMLLTHGATHLTTLLASECRKLASVCKDKDVKSTLASLAADASKAQGAVIMTA